MVLARPDAYRRVMTWLWRIVLGVLILALLVPVLVVSAVSVGLSPRHWSGTEMVAIDLRFLGRTSPPSDPEGRTYPDSELASIRDGVSHSDLPDGVVMVSTDSGRHQVIVATTALNYESFRYYHDRYGDAVALTWLPLSEQASADMSTRPPSTWSASKALSSWLTLATGFPWYLGAGVVLTIVGWLLLQLPRRRRRTKAATTAAQATPST